MTSNKITQENYNSETVEEQVLLPFDLGRVIPEDDSVRLLNRVLEEVDYKKLNSMYSSYGRKPVVEPKTLFKIIVYGYMNNIYSSRMLESACTRDINFMWLLNENSVPDHSTISRFKSEKLSEVIDDLFSQFVKKLKELGEISYENIFIDGTKIESSANKYTFVWKKSVTKNETRLQEKLRDKLCEIQQVYGFEGEFSKDKKIEVSVIARILENLYERKVIESVEFVYGKGKRKTPLQRDIESLEEMCERQLKYDDYTEILGDRNSFSKTDREATFMRLKEDHMRNGQLKPAYNVQIGVEGEYVVGVDISDKPTDQLTLWPLLEKSEKLLGEKYKNIVADAGYESEENYTKLEENEQTAYIKPSTYEQQKKRNFKNKIGRQENMIFDSENNTYTCTQGKLLTFIGFRNRTSKSGFVAKTSVYECVDCSNCPVKSKCTRAEGNKKLQVSHEFIRLRAQSQRNITTHMGTMLRMNRSIQVEGVFGILKQNYGFRRFLSKGKNNVKTEFTLLCLGYNFNKLHRNIQNHKLGTTLYPLKTA